METVETLTKAELRQHMYNARLNLRGYRVMLSVPRDKRKIPISDKEICEFIELERVNLAILWMANDSIASDFGEKININV